MFLVLKINLGSCSLVVLKALLCVLSLTSSARHGGRQMIQTPFCAKWDEKEGKWLDKQGEGIKIEVGSLESLSNDLFLTWCMHAVIINTLLIHCLSTQRCLRPTNVNNCLDYIKNAFSWTQIVPQRHSLSQLSGNHDFISSCMLEQSLLLILNAKCSLPPSFHSVLKWTACCVLWLKA